MLNFNQSTATRTTAATDSNGVSVMTSLRSQMDAETGFLSSRLRDQGLELRDTYQSAEPFPHIVIDDFLPPALLERCQELFPDAEQADTRFDSAQERLKFQFNPDTLAPAVRALFYSFNSRPFLKFLQNVTGIEGLIPDPYFLGGGFHEIRNGGHLSIHADFNHHKPMNLERRLNVLIYLNKGWQAGYGGELELWNADMSRCIKSVPPEFNRCVVFSTTETSFHGNPNPVNHPDGWPRRSIALYYYTSTWDNSKRTHTTQFKARPRTDDKAQNLARDREFLNDWAPPILARALLKLKRAARTPSR
jgi:2OG-Fe(II) oxygenase superfamily